MNEIKLFFDFLSKLTLKDLDFHFTNVVNLYTKPISAWKKIILNNDNEKTYNLFLLVVIYYSVIIFFLIDNSKFVIPITILELFLTLIPFSFLFFPFIFFRNKWCKNLKSENLFKLIFVLKIQFNIPLIALVLLVNWTKMESIFILIDNYVILILGSIIIIPPIILKINIYKKIIWIITNYIFQMLFLYLLVLFASNVTDSDLLADKITLQTPTLEYDDFHLKYNYSDIIIDDKYFINIITVKNNQAYFRNSQFANNRLVLKLMKIDSADLKKFIKKLKNLEKQNITSIDSDHRKTIIKLTEMDTLRIRFDKLFYKDLKFTSTIKAKFKSNSEIFKLHNKLLRYYDSIYHSQQFINKIVTTKNEFSILSNDNNYIVIYKMNEPEATQLKNKILALRNKLITREKKARFLFNIYIKPVEYVTDILDL
ncbi:hypothetical protein IR010_03655 [Flavobacterium sp. MR2016-29]|uniref:hypothetical protein n=1 Tax=Flavobacterium sp. MR2016-29 TaxID=2783795 RepID=UPI00188DC1B4|nr:hypothetical protein [Flavobacterium sp. MR2016-29]MBF4491623.1 hypothetical protein [Flavobacterium sp. MR2016-29]